MHFLHFREACVLQLQGKLPVTLVFFFFVSVNVNALRWVTRAQSARAVLALLLLGQSEQQNQACKCPTSSTKRATHISSAWSVEQLFEFAGGYTEL